MRLATGWPATRALIAFTLDELLARDNWQKCQVAKNNGIWRDSTRWANLARTVSWGLYDRILRSFERRRSVRAWSPSGRMRFFYELLAGEKI